MRKIALLLLVGIPYFAFAQMPNIESVWMNNSKPYTGIIGNKNKEIRLKINLSEQNKKNDQEYFVAGYTLVDTHYLKFEGKFIITKYSDSKNKGVVYGIYDLAEEPKGKLSGSLKGKFIYRFKWNENTEKIENPKIELIGDWSSYDQSLVYKTRLKNN